MRVTFGSEETDGSGAAMQIRDGMIVASYERAEWCAQSRLRSSDKKLFKHSSCTTVLAAVNIGCDPVGCCSPSSPVGRQ